jgi:hypothetical protein
VRREDFTITTAPARLKEKGDLWAALRNGTPADLSLVARYAETAGRVTGPTPGRTRR